MTSSLISSQPLRPDELSEDMYGRQKSISDISETIFVLLTPQALNTFLVNAIQFTLQCVYANYRNYFH